MILRARASQVKEILPQLSKATRHEFKERWRLLREVLTHWRCRLYLYFAFFFFRRRSLSSFNELALQQKRNESGNANDGDDDDDSRDEGVKAGPPSRAPPTPNTSAKPIAPPGERSTTILPFWFWFFFFCFFV